MDIIIFLVLKSAKLTFLPVIYTYIYEYNLISQFFVTVRYYINDNLHKFTWFLRQPIIFLAILTSLNLASKILNKYLFWSFRSSPYWDKIWIRLLEKNKIKKNLKMIKDLCKHSYLLLQILLWIKLPILLNWIKFLVKSMPNCFVKL